MADVEYDRVWKRFTSQTAAAVQGLSLQVPDRELLVMLGPSGCGKTTALRMLAGLEEPDDGDIRIGGKSVVGLEPKDRDIALVFQSYALYPHLSAHDNIGYPLKVRILSKTEQEARIDRVAAMLAIGHLLPRRPGQLCGGEQQQLGTPDDVYDRPANVFVAEFIGSPPMNLMPGERQNGSVVTSSGWRIQLATEVAGPSGDVTVGLRPEGIEIVSDGTSDAQHAEVVAVEPFGSEVIVDAKLGEHSIKIRTAPDIRPAPGSTIALRADPAAVRLFDRETGSALT